MLARRVEDPLHRLEIVGLRRMHPVEDGEPRAPGPLGGGVVGVGLESLLLHDILAENLHCHLLQRVHYRRCRRE